MDKQELKNIVQAIIQASPKPVTLEELFQVFAEERTIDTADIQECLERRWAPKLQFSHLKYGI